MPGQRHCGYRIRDTQGHASRICLGSGVSFCSTDKLKNLSLRVPVSPSMPADMPSDLVFFEQGQSLVSRGKECPFTLPVPKPRHHAVTEEGVSSMSDTLAQKITDEVEIVWVEGEEAVMARYDYVRQDLVKTPKKRGVPRITWDARIVGYANLSPEAEPPARLGSGRWERRVFYVTPRDRSEGEADDERARYQGSTPTEAVDPRTVKPRVVGTLTDRARGRSLPTPEENGTLF